MAITFVVPLSPVVHYCIFDEDDCVEDGFVKSTSDMKHVFQGDTCVIGAKANAFSCLALTCAAKRNLMMVDVAPDWEWKGTDANPAYDLAVWYLGL
jgi:hypothetical protein